MLAATLSAVGGVPVAGLALILGIGRFMSEARALTNLIGNGVATLVVAKWCGQLDTARMHAALVAEQPLPEGTETDLQQAFAAVGQALPAAQHKAAPGAR